MSMFTLLLLYAIAWALGWNVKHCEGEKNFPNIKMRYWVVTYWRGYLSGARWKWFAFHGAADATSIPSSLAPVKSRMVCFSGAGLSRLSWEKRPLNGCSNSSSSSSSSSKMRYYRLFSRTTCWYWKHSHRLQNYLREGRNCWWTTRDPAWLWVIYLHLDGSLCDHTVYRIWLALLHRFRR